MWGSKGGCDDWNDDVMHTHIIIMCDIRKEVVETFWWDML